METKTVRVKTKTSKRKKKPAAAEGGRGREKGRVRERRRWRRRRDDPRKRRKEATTTTTTTASKRFQKTNSLRSRGTSSTPALAARPRLPLSAARRQRWAGSLAARQTTTTTIRTRMGSSGATWAATPPRRWRTARATRKQNSSSESRTRVLKWMGRRGPFALVHVSVLQQQYLEQQSV